MLGAGASGRSKWGWVSDNGLLTLGTASSFKSSREVVDVAEVVGGAVVGATVVDGTPVEMRLSVGASGTALTEHAPAPTTSVSASVLSANFRVPGAAIRAASALNPAKFEPKATRHIITETMSQAVMRTQAHQPTRITPSAGVAGAESGDTTQAEPIIAPPTTRAAIAKPTELEDCSELKSIVKSK